MPKSVMDEVIDAFGGRLPDGRIKPGTTERIAGELGVANTTVRNWIAIGRVPDSRDAQLLSWALERQGTRISVARLAAIPEHQWPRPDKSRRGPKNRMNVYHADDTAQNHQAEVTGLMRAAA